MLVLTKLLQKLSHVETEANQTLTRALLCSLSLCIHLVDAVCRGHKIFHVVLSVKLVMSYPCIEFKLITVSRVQMRLDPLEVA